MAKVEVRKGGKKVVSFHATDKRQMNSVIEGLQMASEHADCKESKAAVAALQAVQKKYGMAATEGDGEGEGGDE